MKKLKIVAISDSHNQHWKLKVPKCDIFIFAGDAGITSLSSLHDFNGWLGTINVNAARIIIAGNHDRYVEHIGKDIVKSLFTNAIYLEDEMIEIEGLKIYGSPWTPEFNSWSFMQPRRSKELRDIWKKIPKNTDILVTHGPAYQVLDKNLDNQSCGCEVLQRELFKKKPKIHLFGHIHGHGNQHIEKDNINFYNCSVLNEQYELAYKPTIIKIGD